MAKANSTRSTVHLAETEFFTYAAVYDLLARTAKEASPEAFTTAANCLDVAPTQTLRGLSYLTYLLTIIDKREVNSHQYDMASRAIGEVTALIARMMEHQEEAALLSFISEVPA